MLARYMLSSSNLRHLVHTHVFLTAGLAESNGSLLPVRWLKVTCGLTACTPGSAPSPTLANEYGITLPLPRNRTDIERSLLPVGHVQVVYDINGSLVKRPFHWAPY